MKMDIIRSRDQTIVIALQSKPMVTDNEYLSGTHDVRVHARNRPFFIHCKLKFAELIDKFVGINILIPTTELFQHYFTKIVFVINWWRVIFKDLLPICLFRKSFYEKIRLDHN